MPYAIPPHIANTNAGTGDYSHVQHWQQSEEARAQRTAAAQVPDGAVLDMSNDAQGRPNKAHVRGANGHIKTITFDANQNAAQSQDGYC